MYVHINVCVCMYQAAMQNVFPTVDCSQKSLKNTSLVTATTLLNKSVVRKEITFVNGTMLPR